MESCVYDSAVDSVRALIMHLIAKMEEEPERVFNFAFSGGDIYALLFDVWGSEFAHFTPWNRMRLFQVEEQCVPFHHSGSLYGTMYRLLLRYVPGIEGQCFFMNGSNDPQEEARRYARLVKKMLPAGHRGIPSFDAVFLAAYPQGDLSIIRNGQEHLLASHEPYVVTLDISSGQFRIGMTGHLLSAAKQVYFLMLGDSYQPVVHDIFHSGDTASAVYVAHHARQTTVFMDQWAKGNS